MRRCHAVDGQGRALGWDQSRGGCRLATVSDSCVVVWVSWELCGVGAMDAGREDATDLSETATLRSRGVYSHEEPFLAFWHLWHGMPPEHLTLWPWHRRQLGQLV